MHRNFNELNPHFVVRRNKELLSLNCVAHHAKVSIFVQNNKIARVNLLQACLRERERDRKRECPGCEHSRVCDSNVTKSGACAVCQGGLIH